MKSFDKIPIYAQFSIDTQAKTPLSRGVGRSPERLLFYQNDIFFDRNNPLVSFADVPP